MAKNEGYSCCGKALFVGIDLHKAQWHVTVVSEDRCTLFSNRIPGQWISLRRVLSKYRKQAGTISAVYEAGFMGYWLADHLDRYGVRVTVTPPNKIPRASGDRVKTDRIDSRKLAELLRLGALKEVAIPIAAQREHREVARRRRRLIQDRVRCQTRIKSFLAFYGIQLEECRGKWTRTYVERLHALKLSSPWLQESFNILLDQFHQAQELVNRQTSLMRKLSRSIYREQVELLATIPGVGWKTAIEILVELQDVRRFRRADQIGAYLGLTPSQFTTADKVRMGRITRQGKASVRMLLVEAAWRLIRKDAELRSSYESIKSRAGSKKAIVGIARRLVVRMRRMLIDQTGYAVGIAA